MIYKLKEINDKLIKMNQNNAQELKKYQLIRQILEEKNSFLHMNIEYAYAILRDLQIPENELKNVYMQLIDFK